MRVKALTHHPDRQAATLVLDDPGGRVALGLVVPMNEANRPARVAPDALALGLRTGVPIYATSEALGHAAGPPACGGEVTRWLDELKPDDFARGPRED